MSTNLYDEENDSKFMRKAKENPFVPVGEYVLRMFYAWSFILIFITFL